MKILLMMLFLADIILVQGQKPILLSEDSLVFGKTKHPAFLVSIPEVGYEETLKNWTKALQERTKSKVVTENGEMSIFGAQLKDVENPVNIYSKLLNRDSLILLEVAVEMKKDEYLDKNSGDFEVTLLKNNLKEFAKIQYVDFVKDELQAEEKKLSDLNDELNVLKNDKSKMEKSIQSSKTTIREESDNITLQNTQVASLTAEITELTTQLNAMEEGAAKEGRAGYIKDLEKRKKKMLNDIESSENKISRAETTIQEAERDIPKNEEEQEVVREKIAQQEAVVQKFTDKLNTVKAY
jgi:DNA repair exonuclease SbcCD ATPase subunit